MSCLVVLELENGKPNRPSLATISAAKKLAKDIDVLILDDRANEEVEKLTDARNIYYFSSNQKNIIAEEITEVLSSLSKSYSFLLAPSGTFAKNFMPRLAAILDKQMISDVINIHDENTFDRPIYAGNAIATVKSEESMKLITIRSTAFEPFTIDNGKSKFIQLEDPKKLILINLFQRKSLRMKGLSFHLPA